MASRAELLVEANRRGLLKGEQKAAFDEAVRRGLIEVSAPAAAVPAEPEIDYQQQMIDEMSWGEKALVGVGRGFMDTAQGIKQIGLEAGEELGLVDEGTADAYTAEKTKELGYYNKLADDSPWTAGAGRLIGGIASVPVPGAGVGATLGRRMLSSAAVNAGVGATQFVEEGGSRAGNATIGAVLGAGGQGLLEKGGEAARRAISNTVGSLRARVGGEVMEKLSAEQQEQFAKMAITSGIPQDEITDGLLKKWAKEASESVKTPMANVSPLEREFDFPLTRGQRSGEDALLGAEDALRYGRRGQSARDLMLIGQREQETRAADIVGELRAKFAKDGTLIENRADAGSAILDGVRAVERADKAKMGAAYDVALEKNPALYADDMRSLTKNARAALDEGADPTLPQTANVLRKLKDLNKQLKKSSKDGESVLYGLKDIEMQRKRINTAWEAADNRADRRQVGIIKRAFDESLDDAVVKGLFQGDTAAIAELRSARKLASEYYTKFKGDKDQGRFIKRIIEENPTAEEVYSSLFQAGNLSKQAGANLAKRYKDILGPDSDEWNQVRQAALDTIIKRSTSTAGDRSIQAVSGTQTLNALRNAETANKSLMMELFTKDEIAQIRRFAVLVQQSQPPAKNPSGTTNVLMEEGLKAVAAKGGPADAILASTGNIGVLAAKKAGEFITGYWKEKAATNAAAESFRPFAKHITDPDYIPWQKMAIDKEVFGKRVYIPINQGAAADEVQEDLR